MSARPPERLDRLPVHRVSPEITRRRERTVRVTGLVEHELALTGSDLAGLTRQQIQADLRCEEGWLVEGLQWRGIPLGDVVALAGPLPAAAFVHVCSGGYAVPISIAEVGEALLSEELDGKPLPVEHGGPWRLLMPGRECFTSVKWVDRLELTAEPGKPTGEKTARARLRPLPA